MQLTLICRCRFLDFIKSGSDVEALRELVAACEPAKFGRGTETVLDETYRKAWKMDPENFKSGLDVDGCGLVDVVQTGLLPKNTMRNIRAELYKLNVYGEGAFFKSHKDTPRGGNMFGSLVVVMPTQHKGGELVIRHDSQEWTVDAATLLSDRESSLAYIAFFSDVEHEVLPVTSGHRVTLTYNLFYTWDTSTRLYRKGVSPAQPAHADVNKIWRTLRGLLDNPEFLPAGGTLGFGLRHGYPFPKLWDSMMSDPLECLQRWLKGSDHSLFQACTEVGLEPLLRLIHDGNEYTVLLDGMVDLADDLEDGESAERVLIHEGGGIVVKSLNFEDDSDDGSDESDDDTDCGCSGHETLEVYWVTEWGSSNGVCSERVTYGNEASIEHIYADVCLIVEVGAAADRVQSTSEDAADVGGIRGEEQASADVARAGEQEEEVTGERQLVVATSGSGEETGNVAERRGGGDSDDGASTGAT
ncbi:hypothetical protein OH76DRAFT_1449067 [Lentinus brumalis]|uniref:Fe2OG dioxygenase domain-containing protein n=1 Tax=Lentinus brumalis TaxID=2498619 RepID=A0A371CNP5_9APHY|nr:hypothetical protein OH76DRAFT_1449067 [Polyporus brumalis]